MISGYAIIFLSEKETAGLRQVTDHLYHRRYKDGR